MLDQTVYSEIMIMVTETGIAGQSNISWPIELILVCLYKEKKSEL